MAFVKLFISPGFHIIIPVDAYGAGILMIELMPSAHFRRWRFKVRPIDVKSKKSLLHRSAALTRLTEPHDHSRSHSNRIQLHQIFAEITRKSPLTFGRLALEEICDFLCEINICKFVSFAFLFSNHSEEARPGSISSLSLSNYWKAFAGASKMTICKMKMRNDIRRPSIEHSELNEQNDGAIEPSPSDDTMSSKRCKQPELIYHKWYNLLKNN